MSSKKLVTMDIDELRGWAAFLDKAVVASLVATILAVGALVVATLLSFKFSGAVRLHEQAIIDAYKSIEGRSAQLQRDADGARERVATLEREVAASREQTAALERQVSDSRERAASVEQEVATAREKTAALERQVAAARDRAASVEQEAAAARQRAASVEQDAAAARQRAEASSQAARDATERAARADRETAAAAAKERALELDAAEIRQRLAALGQQVRKATEQGATPADAPPAAPPPAVLPTDPVAASPDKPTPPTVAALRKHAGTKAAIFLLDQVSAAPAAGAAIAGTLDEAGWVSQTWRWTGVAGIFGVVVLVREGSDPATDAAASALLEQLRSDGFSVTKGDWPADWRRYRGTLDGPPAPSPTDAPIRIVVGIKPR